MYYFLHEEQSQLLRSKNPNLISELVKENTMEMAFEIQFGQEMMDYVLFLQRMYMDKKNFIGDFNEHIGKFHKLLT